jgi:MPBQ/MSBQ methyltransferase
MQNKKESLNNRRCSRISHHLEVEYYTQDQASTFVRHAKVVDITLNGLQLNLFERVSAGQRIRISFKDSFGDQPCHVDGIVAWQSPTILKEGAATGIHFSPDQISISKYLKSTLGAEKFLILNKESRTSLGDGSSSEIGVAYDGSSITFKLLRLFGWGPLNNIGYFKFPAPFAWANLFTNFIRGKTLYMLPNAQRRLVKKSIDLLGISRGDKVLDVACGKGASTFMIANLHPDCIVTGIDLLSSNIDASRALYGGNHNLRFLRDDAMNINFGDGTFDKIICIEAAFHFPDRHKFISEAYRLLKPGGKFLVVDFMWTDDKSRLPVHDLAAEIVKKEWQWTDFYTIKDYLVSVKKAGFVVKCVKNWTANVTKSLQTIYLAIASIGSTDLGRKVLSRINPLLECFTNDDWKSVSCSAKAHKYVSKRVRYISLLLAKDI